MADDDPQRAEDDALALANALVFQDVQEAEDEEAERRGGRQARRKRRPTSGTAHRIDHRRR